jgi:hypothetical protein
MNVQQNDLFDSLFEPRDHRVARLGNPLQELDANVSTLAA